MVKLQNQSYQYTTIRRNVGLGCKKTAKYLYSENKTKLGVIISIASTLCLHVMSDRAPGCIHKAAFLVWQHCICVCLRGPYLCIAQKLYPCLRGSYLCIAQKLYPCLRGPYLCIAQKLYPCLRGSYLCIAQKLYPCLRGPYLCIAQKLYPCLRGSYLCIAQKLYPCLRGSYLCIAQKPRNCIHVLGGHTFV